MSPGSWIAIHRLSGIHILRRIGTHVLATIALSIIPSLTIITTGPIFVSEIIVVVPAVIMSFWVVVRVVSRIVVSVICIMAWHIIQLNRTLWLGLRLIIPIALIRSNSWDVHTNFIVTVYMVGIRIECYHRRLNCTMVVLFCFVMFRP
jgi:hypothetical protein